MKTPLSKTRLRISLVLAQVLMGGALLIAASKPALSYNDNCSPVNYYRADRQTITKLDPILTATIIGDPSCRVYLYSFNDSGNLVKLNSYGVVGDRVQLYSLVLGVLGHEGWYYQVYFPKTRFWAWLPKRYLMPDRDTFDLISPDGYRVPFLWLY